ncbi:amidohydrolase family protein [Variovorax sp. CY25R-8]|uniref:amidohydrolase family protein n=1 Tax=Variovorax sp. CY25R-8 TaxID=2855501 RepID=UPI0021BA689A|nr:amidohydrolase family protein [Variovorax sp. CY25R-8]MCT8174015.1 amidohydrolase family protein [Variovorax sp. CY25R-8]
MNKRHAALASSRPSFSHPSSSRPRRHALAAVAVAALLATACGGGGGGGGGFLPIAGGGGPGGGDGGNNEPPVKIQALSTLQGSTKDVAIEFHEGTNMAAAPSPDGQRVAFTAQGVLWVVPIAGGKATRITGWDMEPTSPVWSPDGSSIAFQNYDAEGNFHIWTVRPNGADLTRITSGPFDDREPAWTPDGRTLVFASDRSQDRQYKIWQVELGSRKYSALTQGAGTESNPVVSPDGTQLAFVSARRIFTQPMGSTEAPKLVGAGVLPVWLPDGSGLAYQGTTKSIVVAGKEVVAPNEDMFAFPPRWLPGGRFLYTADGKIKIRNAGGDGLSEVPFSATLEVRRPVFAKSRERGFGVLGDQPVRGISSPVISPDGRRIAFVALNDIWVMPIGGTPVRLTNDKDRDGNPQFTPDGSAVYFSTEKGNGGALAIDRIDIASRARTRLGAQTGKSMVMPKMSPAGDRIAYTTGSGTLEVWDIASKTAQKVVEAVGSQISTPQWTPDGKRIVVVDNDSVSSRSFEGYNKLRVIDLGTKSGTFYPVGDAPRQISDREEGAAVVSPDGSKVAFVMDSVLHVMPLKADGSPDGPAKAITTEAADLPSWAGDSRTLLYKAADKLKTIGADGAGATEVPVSLTWKQAASQGTTVVRAGQLWSGKDGQLQNDVDIVIKGNRITAIQPHDEAVAKAADKYVDASGLTVMPGLWDAHSHPLTLYQGGQYGQGSASMLAYGVTSTQSVGGPLHQSIEMREALEAGNLLGPRLFVSPPLWDGNRITWSFARSVRTPEAADLEIAKVRTLGVDYLKAYMRAPIPLMHKIAQAALDIGIPSGTHNLSPGAASGLAETTHLSAPQRLGYGWSRSAGGTTYQDAYDLHGKGDFRLIHTALFAYPFVGADLTGGDRFELLTSPNFLDVLRSNPQPPTEAAVASARLQEDQVSKLRTAGAMIAIGTDSPLVPPGIALHNNMRAAALTNSNLQVLQDVTVNAARMSLVDKDLGTVEVGKLADLAIVRGNPLQDLKAAADVRYVVKNGVSYSLAEILAPFRTPAALAERRRTVLAYQRLCRTTPHECGEVASGYGHDHHH